MKLGEIANEGAVGYGKPLEGIRVLAAEQMQALPYATQLLARLGAEVVKVEHPTTGESGRGSSPFMVDPEGRRVGATYLRNNFNKRSVGLDLKAPEGRELFLDLVPHFDVVAENFKAGTLDRLGLGYDVIAERHPSVIHVSLSGFGNDSPYRDWAAYASIVEAMSGIYAYKTPDGPPTTIPVGALGDISGATREDNEWDGTFEDEGIITTDAARVTSLWYRWLAPTNGLAQIKVFDNYSGATNHFIYGVYTGDNLIGLSPVLLARQPTEFMAVAGTEYSISVNNGLSPGDGGEFQVQIEFYPTPLNDLLTNAIPIVAGQVYSAYTHAATNETSEISGNSTWWQFGTLQGGTLEVPLTAGVEATLWRGESTASLTQIPAQYHTATDYHFPGITTNNYFFVLPTSGSYKLRVSHTTRRPWAPLCRRANLPTRGPRQSGINGRRPKAVTWTSASGSSSCFRPRALGPRWSAGNPSRSSFSRFKRSRGTTSAI